MLTGLILIFWMRIRKSEINLNKFVLRTIFYHNLLKLFMTGLLNPEMKSLEKQIKVGFLIVIAARHGILGLKMGDVKRQLDHCLTKLEMYKV